MNLPIFTDKQKATYINVRNLRECFMTEISLRYGADAAVWLGEMPQNVHLYSIKPLNRSALPCCEMWWPASSQLHERRLTSFKSKLSSGQYSGIHFIGMQNSSKEIVLIVFIEVVVIGNFFQRWSTGGHWELSEGKMFMENLRNPTDKSIVERGQQIVQSGQTRVSKVNARHPFTLVLNWQELLQLFCGNHRTVSRHLRVLWLHYFNVFIAHQCHARHTANICWCFWIPRSCSLKLFYISLHF